MAYLLPVVGIVLGFLVLNETIDGRVLAGTVLIVGGVALVNSKFGQRRLFGRQAKTPLAAGAGATAGLAQAPVGDGDLPPDPA